MTCNSISKQKRRSKRKVKSPPNSVDNSIHPTVLVKVGDRQADIDVEIAGLIEQVWIADINTFMSCQENQPGIAWIQFVTAIDAGMFLDIVAGEIGDECDSLYSRIYRLMPHGRRIVGTWDYETFLFNSPAGALFLMSVRFPVSDIPHLVCRLRAFNADKAKITAAEKHELRNKNKQPNALKTKNM